MAPWQGFQEHLMVSELAYIFILVTAVYETFQALFNNSQASSEICSWAWFFFHHGYQRSSKNKLSVFDSQQLARFQEFFYWESLVTPASPTFIRGFVSPTAIS